MFRRIEDFKRSWHQQSAGTVALLRQVTDEALAEEVAPGHRTLGRIAWHLAQTIPEMMGKVGLAVTGPAEDAPVPKTAAAIADAYEAAADSLLAQVVETWTDETLDETDELYGEPWRRGFTLSALIGHDTHHRGQMTVLLRRAGLRVPGLMGPAKEDWATYGMEVPPV